ncbi:MAG: GWxTD domain-containing protein [Bacteroidota bacterium]|jgi:GWxTD domain-containing protein
MKKILFTYLSAALLIGCTATNPNVKKANTQLDSRIALQRLISKSRFQDNGSSVRIYLSINADRSLTASDVMKEFAISYSLYPDYSVKQQLLSSGTVTVNSENISEDNGLFIVWFDIPKPKEIFTGLVLTEIRDLKTNNKTTNDCFVRFQSGKVGDYFMFFDKTGKKPLAKNFFTVEDTVILRSLDNRKQTFNAFRYKYEFDAAISPMSTTPRAASKSLYVDSAFTISSNTPIVLSHDALYYFSRDTTESFGIGMVVADKRFPKITRPEKLVRPLIYMSTNVETTDLYNSKEPKRTLDNYWLNIMQGNQATAKRTIKAFYQRVEQANKMFTSYKEGWKTDKGMVFIIMGDPVRITRTRDKEVWTYNRASQYSELNFTFTKRSNQFVDDHYELQRYAEYQSIWFPTVEQWRNGDVVVK